MHQSYRMVMLSVMRLHEFPPFPRKVIRVSFTLDDGTVVYMDTKREIEFESTIDYIAQMRKEDDEFLSAAIKAGAEAFRYERGLKK
jgi:hypothetical protein